MNTAVVLVGGKGTRLGELTRTTPKPMMPVLPGKPFLDYLLETIARHDIRDIVLVAGYLGDQIVKHYVGRRFGNARVRVVVEPEAAGTGGALIHVQHTLPDTFFVFNGDSLFDFNILSLVPLLKKDTVAALALRLVDNVGRYGHVICENERITEFREKDSSSDLRGLISGGVYYMRREILSLIKRLPCSIETEIFPLLASQGKLAGEQRSGYFIDIGLPSSLSQAQQEIPSVMRRRAGFFDRDGTLTFDNGYTHKLEDLSFLPGATPAIKACNDAGWLAIVVTNQAGIGRGHYTQAQADAFHEEMNARLKESGAHIDAFYSCPYHEKAVISQLRRSNHPDRKPAPGMLLRAIHAWDIETNGSFIVGDAQTDVQSGDAVGLAGAVVEPGQLELKTKSFLEASKMAQFNDQAKLIEKLIAWNQKARDWLVASALPLWAGVGFDRRTQCFAERIDQTGHPVALDRRIRVQARQTFVFATAMELGWMHPAKDLVRAGATLLIEKGLRRDGGTIFSLDHDGSVKDTRRDLYDAAFIIFALSVASRVLGDDDVARHALELADWTFDNWSSNEGGLQEGEIEKVPPRRQNPHMHMLEALLQLSLVSDAPRVLERASSIVKLFETRFTAGQHGSLLEYFNTDWTPQSGDGGRIVEPGHEMEWFWLLHQHAKRTGSNVSSAAEAIYLHAEVYGVNRASGLIVDELWDDGTVRTPSSRLWPQTERIKANLARFEATGHSIALGNCIQALESLWTFFDVPVAGCWLDRKLEDCSFRNEAAPASSFYHVVLALSELNRVSNQLR